MSIFRKRRERKKRMFEQSLITPIEAITIIAILIVLAVPIIPGIIKVRNPQTVTVTVTGKGTKRKSGDDKYLIYTNVTTYEITDSLFKWRWDSSDLYGTIEVGKTYVIETCGYRIPLLSQYPNIYSAVEVPNE